MTFTKIKKYFFVQFLLEINSENNSVTFTVGKKFELLKYGSTEVCELLTGKIQSHRGMRRKQAL